MFTRVISVQTTPDGFDKAISFAQEQLPGFQSVPGFKGFYLVTDREAGDLMTISLWATREDVEQVEARAAQVRSEAVESTGIPQPQARIYEVEFAHLM